MSEMQPADPGAVPGENLFERALDSGGYAVKLPVFEGPLDLLLHLIRQNEVEITEIPIALVGQQYLEYLELMRELNLDVAAEYLVMAASLAWIKSRMLLPPDGTEDEEEGADPRAELVARLLEYQRFKEAAEELGGRRRLGRDVFAAHGPEPEAVPEAEREIEVGIFELIEAFREVLKRVQHTGAPHEVEVEHVTVRERMIAVMERMEPAGSLEFFELFADGADGAGGQVRTTRVVLVATFLAILELTRLAALRIYQGVNEIGSPSGPIRLRVNDDDGAIPWTERVSEFM
jgi:segregation and condensation protein A